MTYKQNDVFLNAEDCAKIAPYIPKEMLKGWEWWYPSGIYTTHPHFNTGKPLWARKAIHALDTGILGELIMYNRDYSKVNLTLGRGVKLIGFEGQPYFGKGTELQNRRNALIYLIDNGLIEQEGK